MHRQVSRLAIKLSVETGEGRVTEGPAMGGGGGATRGLFRVLSDVACSKRRDSPWVLPLLVLVYAVPGVEICETTIALCEQVSLYSSSKACAHCEHRPSPHMHSFMPAENSRVVERHVAACRSVSGHAAINEQRGRAVAVTGKGLLTGMSPSMRYQSD